MLSLTDSRLITTCTSCCKRCEPELARCNGGRRVEDTHEEKYVEDARLDEKHHDLLCPRLR